jgi:general secretion pathway protein D
MTALAQVAGLNVVYGQLPTRTATLRTGQPVPLADVRKLFESMARANDLEVIEEDGLIRLVPTAGAGAEPRRAPGPGSRASQGIRLFVERLRFADASKIAGTLQSLYSVDERGSYAESRDGPEPLSQQLRRQNLAPYQAPPGGPPPGPAQRPQTAADSATLAPAELVGPVTIVPDPSANALLIRAVTADYETIHAAVLQLDRRPLQVMIEVLIAEVRRNENKQVGINWRIPFDLGDSSVVSLAGATAGDFALKIFGLGSVNADVILTALAASGDVSILSRPVVLAQNGEEARILVGDQRPFIQVSRSLPTDNDVRDQVVQYRNVGTQLSIRPTINSDGFVTLSLTQEVSSATAEVQFGAPVINTREAVTRLSVRDGHTVVIGGLVDRQTEKTNSGVPFLKDIPLLGALFRSSQTRKIASELFIMLTPHVLRSDDESDQATRELRQLLPGIEKMMGDTLTLLGRDTLEVVPGDSGRIQ